MCTLSVSATPRVTSEPYWKSVTVFLVQNSLFVFPRTVFACVSAVEGQRHKETIDLSNSDSSRLNSESELPLLVSYLYTYNEFDSGFKLLSTEQFTGTDLELKSRTAKIGKNKHRTIMYIQVGEKIGVYINI